MEQRKLGNTDLSVSTLCLGTRTFGHPVQEKDSVHLVHWALDHGITFIDAANIYEGYYRYVGSAGGAAEEILGKALKERRTAAILATKVGMTVGPEPDDQGLGRKHVMREIDKSLKRLRTDYVDIYYMHKPDPSTALEETIDTFHELLRNGKIRHYGISNFSAQQTTELLRLCDPSGLDRPVVQQPPYSLLDRQIEKDLLPLCWSENIAVVPYQVLQSGLLTGKYKRGQVPPKDSRGREKPEWVWEMSDSLRDKLDALDLIAKEHHMELLDLAVAWVLAQPGITSAIVGVKSIAQLERLIGAAGRSIKNWVMENRTG